MSYVKNLPKRSDLATDCAAIAPSPLAPDHVTAPSQYAPSRQAHSSFPSRITRNLNSPDDTDDRPQLSMDSAVYPQFSTISERLATYQGWPLGRYFKPDDLVYDGFYYAGYADCLRCFYCGVGLKSWDRNDSVMDEHIRWRPTCGYILAVKGRRFVNQTLQRLRANIPDVDGELTTTQSNRDFVDRARNGPLVPSSSLSGNGSGQESHSTQGNTSSNEAVEAARVMGFSEDVIARALRDLQQPDASTIDKQTFIEYVMSLTTVVDGNETSTSAAGANETSDLNTDGPSAVAAAEPLSGRAQEVVRENERLRSMKTCKICNTGTVGVIFLPCGHLVACTDCAGRTRNCTRCGQYIRATANVYLS
ncbi:hypothetical protein BaRGS_00015699 [Batillaria attramentaria]|uniref:RING-type domain-containing protein n=1 Tax=Batillaria attramentaria TaxID=370345 RepID=A0ABD0L1K5_9CAEN